MIISMTYAVCLLWILSGVSIFAHLFNNFAALACVFIPSGGRVGAARLIRHTALIRV